MGLLRGLRLCLRLKKNEGCRLILRGKIMERMNRLNRVLVAGLFASMIFGSVGCKASRSFRLPTCKYPTHNYDFFLKVRDIIKDSRDIEEEVERISGELGVPPEKVFSWEEFGKRKGLNYDLAMSALKISLQDIAQAQNPYLVSKELFKCPSARNLIENGVMEEKGVQDFIANKEEEISNMFRNYFKDCIDQDSSLTRMRECFDAFASWAKFLASGLKEEFKKQEEQELRL